MHLKSLFFAAALAAAPLAATAAPRPPVEVMFVGVFHMSNPGRDLHNTKAPDVLEPRRQAELAKVAAGLNRFHPTQVAVEWDAATVAERYPKYLAGTLPPSRNEVVQLGFRLARLAGDKPVTGIDVEGDFPYEPVQVWAKAHGRSAELDEIGARADASTREEEKILAGPGIGAALRNLNSPAGIAQGWDFYSRLLTYGAGAEQPGAELMAAWTRRNYLICANLVQLARPGDRIVVFYGAGHAFLLRRCIADQPGWKLVEPNAYLPQ